MSDAQRVVGYIHAPDFIETPNAVSVKLKFSPELFWRQVQKKKTIHAHTGGVQMHEGKGKLQPCLREPSFHQ